MPLRDRLKENPFILAPMAGITDHPFRTFMRKLGSSVVVTELVSANGIEYATPKTLELMKFDESQRPVGIQLFGEDPEVVAKAARYAEQLGVDFVDLNFGCPVPKVVKKGAGSAILRDPPAVQKMFHTVKSALKIPLTVKIRTGWDLGARNSHEICHIAYNEGLEWVAIHGRTRSQGYEGLADWNYIAEVKSKAQLPIIGNGDVVSAVQACELLRSTGVDGIMIGRGALKNPFIFLEALEHAGLRKRQSNETRSLKTCFLELSDLLAEHCDEHILQIQLRKFAAWFATGYPHSSAFRKAIFQSQSSQESKSLALAFFESVESQTHENPTNEGFLMGGHG